MSTFLTTKQAAERIGVSKSTLLRWMHAKDKSVPPFTKFDDKTIRWRADDVDAWADARKHNGERDA